jgi:RNA polymerase sigma factor (sigma-70 family)
MDSLTADSVLPAYEVRDGPPADFEVLYRSEVAAVAAFFARRTREPETVADLTADTFLEALRSFGSFDPKLGSGRSWVFAIARRVYARHCERAARQQIAALREQGHRVLDSEAIEDLTERIDAERAGRELLTRLAELPRLDREALELVDLSGLTPKEAAVVLGATSGALRVRLFRARARLRKEYRNNG